MEQNFNQILEQKFSDLLLKMTLGKEKATKGSGRMIDQTPLLPTPPAHQRLPIECEAQRTFKKDWTPDEHKVDVIEMYLEGKADKWFQGVKIEKPRLNWEEFGELLCRRFNDRTCRDIVEEFNKLQQIGNVEEYQEKFEELKALMMIKNQNLDENYFIFSFISGLKEEIKPMIKMLKPATLAEAFALSQWQEYSLKLQNRGSKENVKPLGENRLGMSRSTATVTGVNSYKIPFHSNPKHPKLGNLQEGTKDPRRLSAQEMQYRRNNGLCFKCGEKFVVGHQCKVGHTNCMILEEEEESAFEDAHPGQAMEMSLHALSEALKRKTITLTGVLDGEQMLILVDTGSSDSYISSELVIGMDIKHQWVDQPFSVIMGNGACVTSNVVCPNVQWSINQHHFRFNPQVMELGGWDIILGVDWMTHFSPITFDFQQLRISLHHEGGEIHLHGQADNCDMDLIRGKDLRTFIEYPHCHKEEIERQVAEMLQKDIVKHSNGPLLLLCYWSRRRKAPGGSKRIDYLGHTITDKGVSMDDSKELRGFLGLTGYYRRFVKHYGLVCKPLTELLKKDNFRWNTQAQAAFEHLKKLTCSAPVLRLPDFKKAFVVETDASGGGIEIVLMQEGHPIAFLRRALSPKNLGLSVYEKELLALVMAVTKGRHYLVGSHFIIRTDHRSLKYLLDQKLNTALQHKWMTKLIELDYEIQYKKGTENQVADALSRRHGNYFNPSTQFMSSYYCS
ncbi:uncharacterized protein [Coffea arabica]|uniref:RNA-directed DNA polymerase n=1 Tax=Coffea arabica TaxID=13443 RepID=A0ABM4VCA5_COFAR